MGGHGICTAAAAPVEEEPPSPPRLGELTASHVSPDSVQLEWSVPAGSFDSFTVQYKDAQGQPQVVPVDGGSRSVTVPGLSPSRRYKFNLYGVWGRKRLGPVSTDAVTGEGRNWHLLGSGFPGDRKRNVACAGDLDFLWQRDELLGAFIREGCVKSSA